MAVRTVTSSRFSGVMTSEKSLSIVGSPDFAASPITPVTTGFSFSAWFLFNNSTQDHSLVNWESTFDRNGINFRRNSGTGLLAIVGSNASTTVFILTQSSKTIQNGVWYFITVTYAAPSVKVYVNGTQVLLGSGTITSNATALAVGRRSHSASQYLNGLVKNFTYQNTTTAWTTTQINDLYIKNIVPSGAYQWTFNNTANDITGGNAMTLTGTTYSTNVPSQFTARGSAGSRTTAGTRTSV